MPKIYDHYDGTVESHYASGTILYDFPNGASKWVSEGATKWYYGGKLHRTQDNEDMLYGVDPSSRDDLPAVIRADGTKEWYWNGLRHREGGLPAIIRADGVKKWYDFGELWSIEDSKSERYVKMVQGQYRLHREDGPAVLYPNGTKKWYQEGNLHREDGPAVEYCDGRTEWWVNGKQARRYKTKKGWVWRLDGKLHRDGGLPAVEYGDGSFEWWVNGKLHRVDGPAIDRIDGYKEWRIDDKLHRIGGRAVECNETCVHNIEWDLVTVRAPGAYFLDDKHFPSVHDYAKAAFPDDLDAQFMLVLAA